MVKSIEAKGDTIEAAVENALQLLGLDRDDVSVEVLKNPKSGFLGIGKEPAIVRVSYSTSPGERAKSFLEGLLIRFGTPAEVRMTEDTETNTISMELSGEKMGAVIGRRGDTLDAIQYLTNIVANRDEDERWRVVVDTENYRAKRENSLESLAEKTAQKVIKYRKSVALEPMNPHERRIIHSALQGNEAVTTYSIGSEPNRKVVVALAGSEGQQQRSGGSGTAGGGKPRRRRRRSGPKKEYAPGQSASAEE